jgi:hypothetical protein
MGTEPSPFRSDIVPALEAVEQTAQNIVIAIDRYLPPDGVPYEFINALNEVAGSAQIIVENTQFYINSLTCTPLPVDCAGIHDEITCNDTCGSCIWVPDVTGGGECRAALP